MRIFTKIITGGILAALVVALGVSPALAAAELTVTKDAKVNEVDGCEFILFSVEVQNTGDATAENVTAVDTLDSRFVFAEETTVGFTHATRSILSGGITQLNWTLGDLEPGEDALLAYSVVAPLLSADTTINNAVMVDADNTVQVEGDVDVLVNATPVGAPCEETAGGGVLPIGGGTGGPLPSTGVNPLIIGALLLPLAWGVERWAWAREQKNA